jgi:HEPN domain-containing protein
LAAKTNRHKKWFAEAIYDLKIGKTTFDWPDRSLPRCGYFAHQCIEMALKGYLVWAGASYPKIHDLGELAEKALKNDASLATVLKGVEDLNIYYLAARYPDAADDAKFKNSEQSIEGYLAKAQVILDELLARVNASAETL